MNNDILKLVDRVYAKLNDLQDKTRVKLPMPEIEKMNRKTFFTNFRKVASVLNRTEGEFSGFIEIHLESKVSINENGVLVIDNILRPDQVKVAISKFVKEHVQCIQCGSLLTKVVKKDRMTTMECCKCCAIRTL